MTRFICRAGTLVDLLKLTNASPNRVILGPGDRGEYTVDILDGLPEGTFRVTRPDNGKLGCLLAFREEFTGAGLHIFPESARPAEEFDPLNPGYGFSPYLLPPHIIE